MEKTVYFYPMNKVVENLITIRKEKKITQSEIAFEYGVSAKSISDLERGERKLEYDLLKCYANVFNMSIEQIENYHLKEEGEVDRVGMLGESDPSYGNESAELLILRKYVKKLEDENAQIPEIKDELKNLKEYLFEAINALDEELDYLVLKNLKQKIDGSIKKAANS